MKLKSIMLLIGAFLFALPHSAAQNKALAKSYLVITDYIKNDGKKDVSDAIQKVIDKNPNRTIFFPDGTYNISKPILTPADPSKSVALLLSNYAIIRAMPEWSSEEAMIRLGAAVPFNNITKPGSNYYLEGGVIDCNNVAKGVSIDSGRETAVRNTSIKSATLGLHVKKGANGGSSDCDIENVNITGSTEMKSVGVLVEGFDNTFTNMRIGGVHTGFIIRSGGNYLRNIHPLYYSKMDFYGGSCGFRDEQGSDNWYDFCYSDEFETGFWIKGGNHVTLTNCFTFWYSKRSEKHLSIHSEGRFTSTVMTLTAGMNKGNAVKENKILETTDDGGNGIIFNTRVYDHSVLTDHTHERYMTR